MREVFLEICPASQRVELTSVAFLSMIECCAALQVRLRLEFPRRKRVFAEGTHRNSEFVWDGSEAPDGLTGWHFVLN